MQRKIAPARPALDWDDARLLLALLRAPTLVAGARALGIDKSTASRRIDALEKALGARLFVRTREGLRPSLTGERLRAHAERIEQEMLALASAAVAGDEGEIRGRVRIATTEGMAARLVRGGLLDLQKSYPRLELELLGGNRPVDLARGEAELAVRVIKTTDPSLAVRVLGKFPISLFASSAYVRSRGLPRSAAQLEGHDVLLPSGELEGLPESRWLRDRPGVRVVFRSSSLPALIEACALGHGIVPITRAWGESVSGLEHLFELEHVAARPTWLVLHPDVGKQPAVRVVAERIAEAFRALGRPARA
ncbi:MAG: LysR family transcriptional regulator [Sandaracinus sp.]